MLFDEKLTAAVLNQIETDHNVRPITWGFRDGEAQVAQVRNLRVVRIFAAADSGRRRLISSFMRLFLLRNIHTEHKYTTIKTSVQNYKNLESGENRGYLYVWCGTRHY